MHDLTWRALDSIENAHLIDGWQFNGPDWLTQPFPRTVRLLKEMLSGSGEKPYTYLIANIGANVLTHYSPQVISETWESSGISHLLLDTSGGLGLDLDASTYLKFIEAFRESMPLPQIPRLSVGIAGGLGDEDGFEKIQQIFNEFSQISVDAESKLRDFPENFTSNDDRLRRSRLNMKRTLRYIDICTKIMSTAGRHITLQ